MTYCSDCGRPLNDGEVCNCTAGQPAYTPPPQQPYQAPVQQDPYQAPIQQDPYQGGYQQPPQPGYPQQPVYAPKPPNPLVQFFKGFFKNSTGSSMQVVAGKPANSLILGGIYLLLSAIYVPVLVRRTVNWLVTSSASSRREASDVLAEMDYPTFGFLLAGLLGAAVLVFLVAIIWMIVGRGANVQLNFKTSVLGACVSSYPAALCMLLAILISFASIRVGLLFFVISGFVYLAESAALMQGITGKRTNYLYGLLFFVAAFVAVFLAFKVLDAQLLNIAYEGETLNESINYGYYYYGGGTRIRTFSQFVYESFLYSMF